MSRVIYVSGPSGMAKTKVKEKLERLAMPLGIRFQRVIVVTSRDMRPGETQGNPWYFKSAADIDSDRDKDPARYLRVEIRKGEPQGLDAQTEFRDKLTHAGVLWCELHVTWFKEIERWLAANMPDIAITKVFFAPLSEAEVLHRMAQEGRTCDEVITAEMLRRLVARRDANLDNAAIEKLQKRAQDAAQEYAARGDYDCIVVNHQGEESSEWGAPAEFPTGEAARVLQQFSQVYKA